MIKDTGASTATVNLIGDQAGFAAGTTKKVDTSGVVSIQPFTSTGFTGNFDWTGLTYANVASITEGAAGKAGNLTFSNANTYAGPVTVTTTGTINAGGGGVTVSIRDDVNFTGSSVTVNGTFITTSGNMNFTSTGTTTLYGPVLSAGSLTAVGSSIATGAGTVTAVGPISLTATSSIMLTGNIVVTGAGNSLLAKTPGCICQPECLSIGDCCDST